jgi:hypothetical protein
MPARRLAPAIRERMILMVEAEGPVSPHGGAKETQNGPVEISPESSFSRQRSSIYARVLRIEMQQNGR